MSDLPRYKQWRVMLQRTQEFGERLEKLAEQMGIPEFRVYPEWYYRYLKWAEADEDIHAFAARVKRVASVIPPEFGQAVVGVDPGSGGANAAPNMQATWQTAGEPWDILAVWVTSERPQCKLDPRHEYKDGVYVPPVLPHLHPECVHVLEELQDECEVLNEHGRMWTTKSGLT